jgi:HK97 family phage portal protein
MPNLFEKAGSAYKAALQAWSFGASSGAPASPIARNLGDDPAFRNGEGLTNRTAMASSGGGQSINYQAKVGDIWRNNSVFIALSWLRRNFPDARVGVAPIGTQEIDLTHPMALLLARPNPYYSFSTLGAGLCFSYVADGNAYALKRRDGYKKPIELYYRPHWMIKPVREKNSKKFVDYYLYKPDARTPAIRLQPDQVVHLRNGMDPDNELCGMSDLKSLLLSVYTEQEANRFIAAILTNLGMAGAIFNHKPREVKDDDGDVSFATLTQAKADAVKDKYNEAFTGEKVGGAMVLDGDWNVNFPTVNIDASFFEKAKDISQADIAAAIGIPAVVLATTSASNPRPRRRVMKIRASRRTGSA